MPSFADRQPAPLAPPSHMHARTQTRARIRRRSGDAQPRSKSTPLIKSSRPIGMRSSYQVSIGGEHEARQHQRQRQHQHHRVQMPEWMQCRNSAGTMSALRAEHCHCTLSGTVFASRGRGVAASPSEGHQPAYYYLYRPVRVTPTPHLAGRAGPG